MFSIKVQPNHYLQNLDKMYNVLKELHQKNQ